MDKNLSPTGYWSTDEEGNGIWVEREERPPGRISSTSGTRMSHFDIMLVMLNQAGIFHETWKDEVGHIYITSGGKGMDVEFQFEEASGQIKRIESLIQPAGGVEH